MRIGVSPLTEAPTPTNNSMNSEPEIEKKGTLLSDAIAFANIVFPVPGAPTNITPLGILAPICKYFLGVFKKSTTSINSSFASFKPATSLKVIFSLGWPPAPNNLALALVKSKACIAPPLACRKINQKNRIRSKRGKKANKTGASQTQVPPTSFISTSNSLNFSFSKP